jgi:predicted short-subunit dehydrogenase-like oxidoreductase (DUF2520 family)
MGNPSLSSLIDNERSRLMKAPPVTLSIIGCGNVGKTLGHLWTRQNVVKMQDILNRSHQSSIAAVDFIQAGHVVRSFVDLCPADVFLIGTPDQHIAECCSALVASNILRAGNIVFHCSGALPSSILDAVHAVGASTASIHPIKSFADPKASTLSFAGTFCGAEGDLKALEILAPAFEKIGGKILSIDPTQKTYYHAAGVVVSNYLTALMELGVQSYMQAGISREQALAIVDPIAQGTLQNIVSLGTAQALTGPIARADVETVTKQLEAFQRWKPEYGELYRLLGGIALGLAETKKVAGLEELSKFLAD